MDNHWWMFEFLLRNKSRSHLLEKIFWRAAFEMQLSHGVLGSSFKRASTVYAKVSSLPPTACAKAVSSLRRESMLTVVYVLYNFFKTTWTLTIVYTNFYRTVLCKRKIFCIRDSNFIPWTRGLGIHCLNH